MSNRLIAYPLAMLVLAGTCIGACSSPGDLRSLAAAASEPQSLAPSASAAASPAAASPAVATGELPSPVASSSPSLEPGPTEPSTPTATPSPRPTPAPTLDWANLGYIGQAKDPVAIGAKANVTLTVPVGPTCKLTIKYPSGSNASLPAPSRPSATKWVWSWTIPAGAQVGTAKGTSTCTYAGIARSGPISFTIYSTQGWDINVLNMPSSRSVTDSSDLTITVQVTGNLPVDSRYTDQQLLCDLRITSNGQVYDQFQMNDPITYKPSDGSFLAVYAIGPLNALFVGTAKWSLSCHNQLVAGSAAASDAGSITLTN